MRSLFGITFLATAALASTAYAQSYSCSGSAQGPAGSVAVMLAVEGNRIVRGDAAWSPRPDPSNTRGVTVLLQRPYSDAEKGDLGPYLALITFNVAPISPDAPKELLVAASTNLAPVIGRKWEQYATAAQNKPDLPPGSTPIAFTGTVLFNRSMPQAGPLLDSLDNASTLITSVTDVPGTKMISKAMFWLNDRAGAEVLLKSAHEQAKKAAASPATACKLAPAPAR